MSAYCSVFRLLPGGEYESVWESAELSLRERARLMLKIESTELRNIKPTSKVSIGSGKATCRKYADIGEAP